MNTPLLLKRAVIGALTVLSAGGLAVGAVALADTHAITVCVRNSGAMYFIGEGFRRTDCRAQDKLLSWNIQGIPGTQGTQGADGAIGPKGDTGAVGPQGGAGAQGQVGPMGLQGPAGAQGAQGVQGIQGLTGAPGIPGTGTGGNMVVFLRPSAWVSVPAIADALAYCQEGETMVGGGYDVSGGGVDITRASIVMIGQRVWMVTAINNSGQLRDVQAIAHCAKFI